MASGSFLFGFMTALLIVLAVFAGSYYYLKYTRWKHSSVKGYLDLIPDLTGAQRQKVQDIRKTFLPEVERIRQDLCQKRMTLARALFSESADRSGVHAAAQDILKLQSELEHAVIEHILEEKEILSESQRQDFFHIILKQFAQGGLGVHDVNARRKF
ncbi:MAG: periplasmic heavy metal sensor [Syntrophobacteraceae bacterium]